MNIATQTMEKILDILKARDERIKEYASEPYGQRRATLKEQREMYKNLTEGELYELVEKHGVDEVNKWLYKMEQGDRHG